MSASAARSTAPLSLLPPAKSASLLRRRVSRARSFLAEFACREIDEQAAVGWDDQLTGIGMGPCCGDMGGPGVLVPPDPTLDKCSPYLIRLATAPVPAGCGLIVWGIRTGVTLLADVPRDDGGVDVYEFDVKSPTWRFRDANVTFHLMWKQFRCGDIAPCDPFKPPGASNDIDGLDTALLYTPPFEPGITPYIPLNGGEPAGEGVGGLGSIRDLRYQYAGDNRVLSEVIAAAGVVVLYAVVKQPNWPERPECNLTEAQISALRREDQFVCRFFSTARYGRVLGSIIFELLPPCADLGQELGCEVYR